MRLPRLRAAFALPAAIVPHLCEAQIPSGRASFGALLVASSTLVDAFVGWRDRRWVITDEMFGKSRSRGPEDIIAGGVGVGTGRVTATTRVGVLLGPGTPHGCVLQSMTAQWSRGLVAGTFKLYIPTVRAGRTQYQISSLRLLAGTGSYSRLGVYLNYSKISGSPAARSMGPSLQILLNHASVTFDAARGLRRTPSEFRITLKAQS